MPVIADYSIITDEPIALGPGGGNGDLGHQFEFTLPEAVTEGRPSILAYRLRALDVPATWTIRINDEEVETLDVNNETFRTVHDVVQSGVLVTGNNRITFVVTSGRIRFNNVVLWWQHDVPGQAFQPG
jgi:hypothetical protein